MTECIKNWNPFPWMEGHCICECEKCKMTDDKKEEMLISAIKRYRPAFIIKARQFFDADAEDVVQDALCKAWSKLNKLKEPYDFKNWLYRLLKNEIANKYRYSENTKKRIPKSLITNVGLDPYNIKTEHKTDIWTDKILMVLESRSKQDRDIFYLKMAEYTYKEIAEKLKIAKGTVGSSLYRTRLKLKAINGEI